MINNLDLNNNKELREMIYKLENLIYDKDNIIEHLYRKCDTYDQYINNLENEMKNVK